MPIRSSKHVRAAFAWLVALGLTGSRAVQAAAPETALVEPLLHDRNFIDACIGTDSRVVEIQIEKATGAPGLALAARLERHLEASGATVRAEVVPTRLDNASLSCDDQSIDTLGAADAGRVTLKIEPFLGEGEVFTSASVLVRSRHGCQRLDLDAAKPPERCNFPRTPAAEDLPPPRRPKVSPPLPPPPAETRDRRRTALFVAAPLVTGAAAFVVRIVQSKQEYRQGPPVLDAAGTVLSATTIVLAGIAGAHDAHVEGRQGRPMNRRALLWFGLGGGVLIASGLVGMGASRYERMWDGTADPVFALPLFVSEVAVAAGVGLTIRAVTRRLLVTPNLAGLTLSGRF